MIILKIENKSKEEGITLISLVITVIVLLILAAVTINLTIGHNGIFSRAQEAKTSYEKESLLEEMRLAMLDKKLEKGEDLTNDDIKDALGKFGEVQTDEDGSVTGVKPKGGKEVITYEEIENGETTSGGSEGESGGSTGPNSEITNAELAALKGKVDNLENTVNSNQASTSASIASIQEQLKTLQEGMAASGDTSQQVAALKSQLEGLKTEVESQNQASKEELSNVKSTLTSLQQTVTDANKTSTSELTSLKSKISALEQTTSTLNTRLTTAETNLTNAKTEFNKIMDSFNYNNIQIITKNINRDTLIPFFQYTNNNDKDILVSISVIAGARDGSTIGVFEGPIGITLTEKGSDNTWKYLDTNMTYVKSSETTTLDLTFRAKQGFTYTINITQSSNSGQTHDIISELYSNVKWVEYK